MVLLWGTVLVPDAYHCANISLKVVAVTGKYGDNVLSHLDVKTLRSENAEVCTT